MSLVFLEKHKKFEKDASVFTFQGHIDVHTLIRCRFSPSFSTGQQMVYAGCASGACVGKVFEKNVARFDRMSNLCSENDFSCTSFLDKFDYQYNVIL